MLYSQSHNPDSKGPSAIKDEGIIISSAGLRHPGSDASATTYVVFRYDDLAADHPGERDHNPERKAIWEAEQQLNRLFEEYGIPYVAAVIPEANPAHLLKSAAKNSSPFSADPEKVSFVKRALAEGRMQVAMHGFNHTNYRPANARASEFSRPFQAQYLDLVAGRRVLSESLGIDRITTFIPPFNGWNEHTASALEKCGFEILSADRYQPGDLSIPLVTIPFTAQLWDLEELLTQNRVPDNAVIIVILHPPQIARITGHEHRFYGFNRFKELLSKLATMPHVKVVTFDGLRSTVKDLTPKRYVAAAKVERLRSLWSPLLPARCLPGADNRFLYPREADCVRVYRTWMGLTLIALAVLLVVTLVTASLVINSLAPIVSYVAIGGSLVGITFVIYFLKDLSFRGFHANSIRFLPLVILVGVLVAAILNVMRLFY